MSARIWQYRRNKARFWRPAKKYRKGEQVYGRGPAWLMFGAPVPDPAVNAEIDAFLRRLWDAYPGAPF